MTPIRVLTNIRPWSPHSFWGSRTHYDAATAGGGSLRACLRAAIRLLRLSRHYDAVVIASGRADNLFLLLASVLRFPVPPVVVGDCLWELPQRGLRRWLKTILFRLMHRSAAKLVVWCRHEIEGFSTALSVPSEKFVRIPHHHSLAGYEYTVSEGDYVFSGGDGHRDFPTLLRAVAPLGIKTIIATRRLDWNRGCEVPPNVVARPTSHAEFRQLMAGSRMVVLPMEANHIHVGGEQTYLNAMAMGKPVIVTDDRGAPDYIKDGVNGLIVPAGASLALQQAIESVSANPAFAAKLAANAKKVYDQYTTRECMERILALVQHAVLESRNQVRVGGRGRRETGESHLDRELNFEPPGVPSARD